MTSTLDEIIDKKTPFTILIQYYLSQLPLILVRMASLACLISVLFTFSSLNNSNEVIVMRSSGLSFWQITRPALCFGLIVSALIFFLNERLVPEASELSKRQSGKTALFFDKLRKSTDKVKNLTFYGLKNRLFFIDTYDPKTHDLEGITIIENDEGQDITQKIVALKGVWTGVTWKFYQCQITTYEKGSTSAAKLKFYPEKLMDIKEKPEDLLKQRIKVTSMNIKQLKEYINRFANSGATKALNNLRVDLFQKIAFPFTNFAIVLMGLPMVLMIKSRKGMTFTSLGIAIAIAFLYYIFESLFIAFGKGGLFPPILAAWSTPILFTGIALVVIEYNF